MMTSSRWQSLQYALSLSSHRYQRPFSQYAHAFGHLQGAASGIGFSTARAFLAAGARGVTLVDLHKGNLAKAQAELEKQYSGKLLSVSGDVTSEQATEEYIEETMKKWGHLDVCGFARYSHISLS